MARIRWEPARELNSLQTEMNRLFNTFFDSPAPANTAPVAQRRWVPAMDLIETPEDFVLHADLPGLAEGDVNIELDDTVLTISGERKPAHESHKEGYYRVERPWGAFSRSLTLPEGVDPDSVKASFDRGVLEVRIPKPEQRKPRKVSISVGRAPATIDASESDPTGSQAPEHNGSTPALAGTA